MPTPNVLGNIVPLSGSIPEGSPPTSYAAHAALNGGAKAIATFGALTLLRSLLIAPGMAIAGVRGKQLFWGSLAASACVSGSALVYCYALAKKNGGQAPAAANTAPAQQQQPIDTHGESA